VERAAAGRALAKLAIALEVMTIEGMQFCHVHWARSGRGELETHLNEHLNHGYWIGRYPVTSAQFQAFVDAGDTERAHTGRSATGRYLARRTVKGWGDNEPAMALRFRRAVQSSNHPVVASRGTRCWPSYVG